MRHYDSLKCLSLQKLSFSFYNKNTCSLQLSLLFLTHDGKSAAISNLENQVHDTIFPTFRKLFIYSIKHKSDVSFFKQVLWLRSGEVLLLQQQESVSILLRLLLLPLMFSSAANMSCAFVFRHMEIEEDVNQWYIPSLIEY